MSGAPLTLSQRIQELNPAPAPLWLDSEAGWRAFTDVREALTPRGYELKGRAGVYVDPALGSTITIYGRLFLHGIQASTIHHTLHIDRAFVKHDLMVVDREMRGTGLALFVLLKSFDYYDTEGLRYVVLQADLSSGKFYWARCGFRFLTPGDQQRVDEWFRMVIEALGLPCSTAGFSRPGQYALLEKFAGATLSIGQIAAAIPNNPWVNPNYAIVAAENEVAIDDQIDLGKAIMVTGPPWLGIMDLRSPDRTVFDAYVQSRLRIIARHV
jgi:hypothetical protein